MSITVLVQGPVTPWTQDFLRRYQDNTDVSEVIFSTWSDQEISTNVPVIKNEYPFLAGPGNRNYQIVSSREGLKYVTNEYVLKIRSDMFLPHLSEMIRFAQETEIDGNIFTLSIYPRLAFHPRDHVFFGKKEYLTQLFDIPLDGATKKYDQFKDVRSETYIGMWYYLHYEPTIQKFIDNQEEYLTDIAPKRTEALEVYHQLIREKKGFLPFPPFQIEFPKYYPRGYPFDFLRGLYGETFHGDKF